MASIKCTNCGAILKTKDEIPAGKKVKCPKCAQPFVVQAEEPAPPPEETGGADPFAFGENAADAEAPKKKPKSQAEPDGDDEPKDKEEDGKPKKKNTMMIALIVVGVLLFCCCPMTCGGIYFAAGQAIKSALGFGEDALKKQIDDAKKFPPIPK